MRIAHNIASLNVYRNYSSNLEKQSKIFNRASTGQKINGAGDNPNALGKSELMRIQIRGLQMAQRNVQDGVSMLQSADSSLSTINGYLNRIKELTIQAGGVGDDGDREVIQNEINQMIEGIGNVVDGSEFNGVKYLKEDTTKDNNNPTLVSMLAGANSGEEINIPFFNLSPENLKDTSGKSLKDLDISKGNIDEALSVIDASINMIIDARGQYGALCNRLETAFDSAGDMGLTLEKAESSIRDADMGFEIMELSKHSLLIEAGNAMMAQTNNFPQDVLRILERVK
ncbi:flagellin [Clostridium hydrogeniformans]|uniref:flagellin N-terminal helical domain-containing protein n=1 Tax=Clostridium hydrogeniformans TaxID=349933 RepID=UPI000487892A|nr:flagellin [Clostridium hydrogeniformans]